jgi:pimeloyl-ACP methyl ester carboxylesterase
MLKTFAGGQLFGVTHGDGLPWILALPGWERDHRDFDVVCRGLDAVVLDLPGFGATAPPPEPWTTAQYAEHVAPVLEAMAERVVVLGHSFGGRVATHLAAGHSDRVSAQVLTGVPLIRRAPTGGAPLSLRLAKSLRRTGTVGDALVERLRQKHGSADYQRATGVMRGVLVRAVNESYEAPWAAFAGPVELIWGAEDDQAPLAQAQAAQAVCRQSHLVVLPGVGHFVPRDCPAALVEAVNRCRP